MKTNEKIFVLQMFGVQHGDGKALGIGGRCRFTRITWSEREGSVRDEIIKNLLQMHKECLFMRYYYYY